MTDATKLNIDADLVAALLRAQFPQWADLPVQPVRQSGWDNRTFRVGADLLARLPSAEIYVPQVDKEQTWLSRLAPHLPLPIPEPVGRGAPGLNYPWPWSVYRWIDGEVVSSSHPINDLSLATAAAMFLRALQQIKATDGPPPGKHNFFRGGRLTAYDGEARAALSRLTDAFDRSEIAAIWSDAISTEWTATPVWLHGDFAPGNLLIRDGKLSAVIDFGCMAVGDPACDGAIAWTSFTPAAREAFRKALAWDPATWRRGRGWALWKALILATGLVEGPAHDRAISTRVLSDIIADGRT